MKKLIIFSILLAAIVLSAVNPWPAQLKVWNWTGDNIYFRLSYRGEQKYFLTATPQGNTDTYRFSLFEVARKKYSSEVTACGVTTTGGSINLNNNLKLTFTDCAMMRQWWRPLYWGEPGMEKPNFYQDANVYQWNVECEWVFPPAPLNPVYLCFPYPMFSGPRVDTLSTDSSSSATGASSTICPRTTRRTSTCSSSRTNVCLVIWFCGWDI